MYDVTHQGVTMRKKIVLRKSKGISELNKSKDIRQLRGKIKLSDKYDHKKHRM